LDQPRRWIYHLDLPGLLPARATAGRVVTECHALGRCRMDL